MAANVLWFAPNSASLVAPSNAYGFYSCRPASSPFGPDRWASSQAFLDPELGASCVDAGGNTYADGAFAGSDWRDWTTHADGQTEGAAVGGGDIRVDIGRLYHPLAVAVKSFDRVDDAVTWEISA